MVIGAWTYTVLIALGQATAPTADAPAAKALAHGGYPWYSAKTDALEPVQPPWRPTWWDWFPELKLQPVSSSSGGSFSLGNVLVILLLVVALAALVAGLVWAYRYYMPSPEESGLGLRRIGSAASTGGLPSGLPADLTDPLGLARALRAQGDLAGAVLALFVHQVMTLDRLRLARLAPGRTARQLVRSVTDTWVRTRVEPTLRLFETSFYGHRLPDPAAFESAWGLAEELEARIAEGSYAS
jgi:hypothetical protein